MTATWRTKGVIVTTPQIFEGLIRTRWDQANAAGKILYRSDTLTTQTIEQGGITLHLLHNACRDAYDQSTKSIDKPASRTVPFYDGFNPELARTADGRFKILGNKFACQQYQCILVPTEPQEVLTAEFLGTSLRLATEHPFLTFIYNALNAGKTVPQQYWLVSFHAYHPFDGFEAHLSLLGTVHGILVQKRDVPCYMLTLPLSGDIQSATAILMRLVDYMQAKSFNLFLYGNHAFFIPREDVEIPVGFENHRFGGLEMIGCFVMKSAGALQSVDPDVLLQGIREISYQPASQKRLETYLCGNG